MREYKCLPPTLVPRGSCFDQSLVSRRVCVCARMHVYARVVLGSLGGVQKGSQSPTHDP